MTTSADVRAQIIDTLRLDLVGPRPHHPPHTAYTEEVLPIAPSKWYLAGFLVPYEAPTSQRADDDGDETLDQVRRPTSPSRRSPRAEGAGDGCRESRTT